MASEFSDKMADGFSNLSGIERIEFFDRLLSLCSSNDLMYLSSRLDEYKRDFVSLLPTEVVDKILGYLNWKDLLNCAQVSNIRHGLGPCNCNTRT